MIHGQHAVQIGDIVVSQDENIVQLYVDGDLAMSVMRKDGGLREIAQALMDAVIEND